MNRRIVAYVLGSAIILGTIAALVVYFPKLRQSPNNEEIFSWEIPENATIIGDRAKITYMVPMNDGIRLATDVYVPTDINESLPVVFVRTPYNKNSMEVMGSYISNDFILVIQDMRGFYASEGELTFPFITDATDGKASIEWIANQPWCNDRIATWGPSALGIAQFLVAPNAPSALKAQMPIVAVPDLYYAMFTGGEFRRELVIPWMEHGGFSEETINSLGEHEKPDELWAQGNITAQFSDVHVPAIHLGGWYDIFTQGTLQGFMGYQYHGGEGAKGNSKLIMGPWVHEGYLGEKSGDFYYPNQNMNILLTSTYALIEAWLRDNFTLWNKLPTVAFYLMSSLGDAPYIANNWYQADRWPLPFTPSRLYLYANGSLLTTPPTTAEGSVSYLYDPSDPTPTIGGGNLNIDAGTYDQRPIEQRDDVVVFTSPALEEEFTFVGQANITLYVSSNCTDTDFAVKLTDVYPDGKSMLITDTIIRARNRHSLSNWEFLTPGEIYEITIPLDSTAYLFKAGHKIRIDISSANYPRFEANPNTGDPLWANTTYYVANNTVFANSVYASSIVFPSVNFSELVPFSWDGLVSLKPIPAKNTPFETPENQRDFNLFEIFVCQTSHPKKSEILEKLSL